MLICGVEEVRSERERLFVQSGLLPSGERLEELIWPPDAKLSGVSAFVLNNTNSDKAGSVWFAPQVIWLSKPHDRREGGVGLIYDASAAGLCALQRNLQTVENLLCSVMICDRAGGAETGCRCCGQGGVSRSQPGFGLPVLLAVVNVFSAGTERLVRVPVISAMLGQVGRARCGQRVHLVLITEHTSKNSTVLFPHPSESEGQRSKTPSVLIGSSVRVNLWPPEWVSERTDEGDLTIVLKFSFNL